MLLKLIVLCVFITQVVKAQTPDGIEFQLFSGEFSSPNVHITLVTGQLEGRPIDVSKPFKFIIHGFNKRDDFDWVYVMKDEYLKKGDYNVVVVNWRVLATTDYYIQAVENTRIVAKHLADLLIDLKTTFGLSFKNVHLVGHSLGAHVSGFTGKNITNSGNEKIARITAMDAASSFFYLEPTTERLAVGDADFIDCIHTDDFEFGYGTSLGDVDFYPNGGYGPQPGCLTFSTRIDESEITACSHCRSYAYFTESISSNGFKSKQCKNYWKFSTGQCNSNPSAIMGENVDLSTRGDYYLNTNAFSPFAKESTRFSPKFGF